MCTNKNIIRHPVGYSPKESEENREMRLEIEKALENNRRKVKEIDERYQINS